LIACTHPHLFVKQPIVVDVVLSGLEAGNTRRVTTSHNHQISVCLDVDAQQVNEIFLDQICSNW